MSRPRRGKPITRRPQPRINAVVDDECRRFAEQMAADHDSSLSDVVNAALHVVRVSGERSRTMRDLVAAIETGRKV